MITSPELDEPRIQAASFTDSAIMIELVDGPPATAPLSLHPRLAQETPAERDHWELIGWGPAIPYLDEDLRVAGRGARKPSLESERSFQRWLAQRAVPAQPPEEPSPPNSTVHGQG